MTESDLTVFFDDPFWVGVFERVEAGKLSVCKHTFGAEPRDFEVWEFVLKHFYELSFSPAVEAELRRTADNPKRRQREALKTERRERSREEREAEQQRRFEEKQQKRKEKHRGH